MKISTDDGEQMLVRRWEEPRELHIHKEETKKKLTESQEAAVLFIKMWKKERGKSWEGEEKGLALSEVIKSYHVALAMEWVVKKREKELKEREKEEKEEVEKERKKEKVFSLNGVRHLMSEIVKYLRDGYDALRFDDRFFFENIGEENPFYFDLKQDDEEMPPWEKMAERKIMAVEHLNRLLTLIGPIA